MATKIFFMFCLCLLLCATLALPVHETKLQPSDSATDSRLTNSDSLLQDTVDSVILRKVLVRRKRGIMDTKGVQCPDKYFLVGNQCKTPEEYEQMMNADY